MKKAIFRLVSLTLSILMIVGAVFSDPSYHSSVKAEDVTISKTLNLSDGKYEINVYNDFGIDYTYYNGASSDNSSVVSDVSYNSTTGVLSFNCLKTGNAIITLAPAIWSVSEYKIQINVTASVGISPNSSTILVGKSVDLFLEGATAFSWSSDNNSVVPVSVNEEDKNKATVSAIDVENQTYPVTATITATVNETTSYTATVTAVKQTINLATSTETLYVGDTLDVTATLGYPDLSSGITWQSSNTSVATVENGKVTAVLSDNQTYPANVTITATADGASATTILTIDKKPAATGISLSETNLTIHEGSSEKITVKLEPESTDYIISSVSWTSEDSTVASVDQNGVIKGEKNGETTTITVEVTATKDETSITFEKSIEVTVIEPLVYVWALDSSGALEEGGKYIIVAESDDYALVEDSGNFSSTPVTISDDGLFVKNPDETIVWTYTEGDLVSTNNVKLEGILKSFSNSNQTITDYKISYVTTGVAGQVIISNRKNDNYHTIGYVDGVFSYVNYTNTQQQYQLRLYKYQETNQSLEASFYTTKNSSDLSSAEKKITLTTTANQIGTSINALNWFEQSDLGADFANLELIGVSVSGVLYTGDDLENLTFVIGKDANINYYYLKKEVSIEYYYVEKIVDGSEKTTLLGSTYTTKNGQHIIYVPTFNADSITEGTGINQISLVNPWPIELERTNLINKNMELYNENGELIKTYASIETEMQLIENNDASDPIDGDSFTLKVYYIKPAERTGNYIQLPTTFRDFQGDGALFEYQIGGDSYIYTLFDAAIKKVENSQIAYGLIQNELVDGKIVYTPSTVDFVATQIAKGTRYSSFAEKKVPLVDYIFSVAKDNGNLGANNDQVKVALSDGVITYDEIIDAYTGAYYLLSHIWDDDGNDDDSGTNLTKEYNKKVTEIRAIQLEEYSDGFGNTYYEYDANKYATVVENGIVKNTKDKATCDSQNAYYHPLDGYGYTDRIQESGNENFLFTTVGTGEFVYSKEKELYFEFSGDDDVYLFINNKLAVDVGGAHQAETGTVYLNTVASSLGLEEGGIYDFTFFHAERRSTGSNFKIRTNIEVTSSSMITEKNAYQNDELLENGEIVDAHTTVYYEFKLTNDGTNHMFNLSFWDSSLGIGLYPLDAKLECRLDGMGPDSDGKYTVKLSNAISAGDIIITISTTGSDGKTTYPDIYMYEFKKLEGQNANWPVLSDNGELVTTEESLGSFNNVSIAEKYKELNNGATGTEEDYINLLQKILMNGTEVGYTISLKGFNRDTLANETFTNRLYTYGTDINNNEVVGTGSTTVRTLEDSSVLFVIDFGKEATYTQDQIFTVNEMNQYARKLKYISTDGPKYGNASSTGVTQAETYGIGKYWINSESKENFTYTLTKFMSGVDTFEFKLVPYQVDSSGNPITDSSGKYLEDDDAETGTKYLYMIPATTVYYEDDFSASKVYDPDVYTSIPDSYYDFSNGIKYYGNWEQATDGDDAVNVTEQDNDTNGVKKLTISDEGYDIYGQDSNYTNCALSSSGSSMVAEYYDSDEYINTATFMFTGDGLEIYSRTTTVTGKVRLSLFRVEDVNEWMSVSADENTKYSDNKKFDPQRLTYEFDKDYNITYTPPTTYKIIDSDNLYKSNGEKGIYQIPVITTNVPYGTYYAVLQVMQVQTSETDKLEGIPENRGIFYLDAIRISNPLGSSGSVTGIGAFAYAKDNEDNAKVIEVRDYLLETNSNSDPSGKGIVYIDYYSDEEYYDGTTYTDYGPKNEVYLKANYAVGFKLTSTDFSKVSLGLKLPYKINSGNSVSVYINGEELKINSATDMYYDITSYVFGTNGAPVKKDDKGNPIIIIEYPALNEDHKLNNADGTSSSTTSDDGETTYSASVTDSSIVSITRIKLSGGVSSASIDAQDLFESDYEVIETANTFMMMRNTVVEEPDTDVDDDIIIDTDEDTSDDEIIDSDDSSNDDEVIDTPSDDNTSSDDVVTDEEDGSSDSVVEEETKPSNPGIGLPSVSGGHHSSGSDVVDRETTEDEEEVKVEQKDDEKPSKGNKNHNFVVQDSSNNDGFIKKVITFIGRFFNMLVSFFTNW